MSHHLCGYKIFYYFEQIDKKLMSNKVQQREQIKINIVFSLKKKINKSKTEFSNSKTEVDNK